MKSKLKTLWQLTAGQRGRYALALLMLWIGTAFMYVPPLVIGSTIDGVLRNNPQDVPHIARRFIELIGGPQRLWNHLWIVAIVIVVATFAGGFFTYLKGRHATIASEMVTRSLRNRLYDHLQRLSCSYHDKAQTGDLVQRCTSDVETVRLFYSNQIVEVTRATVLLIGAIPLMALLDWRMCLVAVSLLPVIFAFAIVFFHKVHGSFKLADEADGAMTTVLQENLTGIRVVRAFARQDFERSKFAIRNELHRDLNYRLYRVLAFYWSASDFMCFTQMASVLVVGAWRVGHGTMSVGTLVAFLSYVAIYIWPVRQMGRIVSEMGKAMVSIGRISQVLSEPQESVPTTHRSEITQRLRGDVAFEDVRFSHAGKTVLDGVSFDVRAGESMAILGPSGSGKSTIINLLLRFYDYERGSIRLDGLELSSLDRDFVRAQFGVVMQEPFLYSKSVRENIRIGRHTAPEEELIDAARVANIHESIESFEKQYDTIVGERGVTLSGGQRQRVAIARAIVKDSPILVLDDALSAVDTETESMILSAMRSRRGRHTTIVIAHRLSTLMHADRIIVLEKGRIVQTGTHEQLVARPGLYRNLWEIQSALQDDLRTELDEQQARQPESAGAAG
ncbi:MAG: ABC transporter ATP-binding protein [Tepidisphaeraceae bacterium]